MSALKKLEQLLSHLKDAETSRRGYVISAEADYLVDFQSALDVVPSGLRDLRPLISGVPSQVERFRRLEKLVEKRLNLLKRSVDLHAGKDSEAADQIALTAQGKVLADEIRAVADQMEDAEEGLLQERQNRAATLERLTISVLAIGYVFGFALLLLAVLNLRREIAAHDQAREALREAHDRLEIKVQERTAELLETNQALEVEIEERRRAAQSLSSLSGQLLRVQDEERRRIARELHDSVGQTMVAVLRNLNQLEESVARLEPNARDELSEAVGWVSQCTRELRTISYLLHPPLLDELGLASALRAYAEGFAKRGDVSIQLDIPNQIDSLPKDSELALFRVVQEALSNIHRHSKSPRARIKIVRAPGELTLDVEDDGVGMPADPWLDDSATSPSLGVGIAGMRERMKQLGGRLEIHSNGKGTVVRAILPLSGNSL